MLTYHCLGDAREYYGTAIVVCKMVIQDHAGTRPCCTSKLDEFSGTISKKNSRMDLHEIPESICLTWAEIKIVVSFELFLRPRNVMNFHILLDFCANGAESAEMECRTLRIINL